MLDKSNQNEEEHAILKRLKFEDNGDSSHYIKEEDEDEKRIVQDFYQLCFKKGLERISKLFLLQKQTESPQYLYNKAFMSSSHQNELLSHYLNAFKPIVPGPTALEIQDYKARQEVAMLNRLAHPPPNNENVVSEEKNTSPKQTKSLQSKYKNCYGLVTGRVIKSTKEYLKLRRQGLSEKILSNARLQYIHARIGAIANLKNFEDFLDKYHKRSLKVKRNRGKSTVYNYLSEDKVNGLVLVELIQSFLRNDNPDLESYILGTRKQIGQVLGDEGNLTYVHEAFKEMQTDLEMM